MISQIYLRHDDIRCRNIKRYQKKNSFIEGVKSVEEDDNGMKFSCGVGGQA